MINYDISWGCRFPLAVPAWMGLGSFPALDRTVRSILPGKGPGGVALLDGIAVRSPSPACSTGRGSALFWGSLPPFDRDWTQVSIEQVSGHASEALDEC